MVSLRVTDDVENSAIDTAEVTVALPEPVCGDLDDDRIVNVSDAMIGLRIFVGMTEPTEKLLILGDVNADGAFNVVDTVTTLQYIVGLLPTLDKCQRKVA